MERGLDLEDLAAGFEKFVAPSIILSAQLAAISLGILSVMLLITRSVITDSVWYLIAVGETGILQNMIVAGWRRRPETLGVLTDFLDLMNKDISINHSIRL